MSAGTKQRSAQNGTAPDPLAEAIAYENAIGEQAQEIRGDAIELTPDLFLNLWPLLKRPIPAGFIETIGVTKGKPYASTGVKSVQVQHDRMNNVLTPLWWWDEEHYESDGKLARVSIHVGTFPDKPIVTRSSRGGVNQGSTAGNIYKGSYTNAAKVAFARLGPGHEVYLGAADLDPDTNEKVAEQQTPQQASASSQGFGGLDEATVERLGKVIRTIGLSDEKANLLFGTVGADAPADPSHNGHLRVALSALTAEQAKELDTELEREAEKDV